MNETQVNLSGSEGELLHKLAQQTGKTEGEVVREALVLFEKRLANEGQDRLALLRQARGIWKDRDDLPELTELRGAAKEKQTAPDNSQRTGTF
jgi:hypothetical protein